MKSTARNFDLEKILEVVIAFNSEKDYFDLLNVILTKMMEITNADAGTLYVLEDNKLHFRIMKTISMNVFQSAKDTINLPPICIDEENIENVSAYAAIKNEIVCIDDVYENTRFNFTGPKNYDKMTGYHTASMLVFPLSTTEEEVIGVIQLINAIDKETGKIKPFSNVYEPAILTALANISANALANMVYAKEIDELFDSFVRVMTKAIDERSPYNVNHTNNVAKYCNGFAEYLSGKFLNGHRLYFDENRRKQLVMSAFLHDIGKIITPLNVMDKKDRLCEQLEIIKLKFEIKKQQLKNRHLKNEISTAQYEGSLNEIKDALELIESSNTAAFLQGDTIAEINKLASIIYTDEAGREAPVLTDANLCALTVQKGTLTDGERKIMQEHVLITGRLLDNMKFNKNYKDVSKWAVGHHEFLDGTGYPLGLIGDDITVEMRILAIIDIFDALVADDRPYKKALPASKAGDILLSMASEGKLDKELAELFIDSRIWEK